MRISDWMSDVCSSDLPDRANQVWSMDFVFDRTADGRVLKALTSVDDATHESVAIEVERAISGHGVVRILERLAVQRGLPEVIRTDNGKEFCGKAMLEWAHNRGVALRLIEPGKRSEAHQYELQSLMRISYAVIWLKKKN